MKKKGFDSLDQHAEKIVYKESKEEINQKINWKKLIFCIWKLLEPEIVKLPRIYVIVPLVILSTQFYGVYKGIELIINIFIK